jgi:hypothetical protein
MATPDKIPEGSWPEVRQLAVFFGVRNMALSFGTKSVGSVTDLAPLFHTGPTPQDALKQKEQI